MLEAVDRRTAVGKRDYAMLLLFVTYGLRGREVAALTLDDLDWKHDRLAALLRHYLELRRSASWSPDAPVFSFTRRGGVSPGTISQTFHKLLPHLGLVVLAGVAPPRAHGLRHAFAVGTLLRWYREGINPARRLLHLATFLGHVSPSSTAVYLTITSELLQEAHRRFERLAAAPGAGSST
jgi:integrase